MIRAAAVLAVGLAAITHAAAQSAWTIHKRPDPLESKNVESYATVDAPERPLQFGKPLRTWLMARCVEQWGPADAWIAISFNFSTPVAISEIKARWRVDDLPIQEAFIVPKAGGRLFEIYEMLEPHKVIGQLKARAKTLKAELILPWAGAVPLTFSVAGSKSAFSQVHCKN